MINLPHDKGFPIQAESSRDESGKVCEISKLMIPWVVAEIAYIKYARRYGRSQSLERLAERGGFGRDEFLELLDIADL